MALPVISPEISSFRAVPRVQLTASIFCNPSAISRGPKFLHFHEKYRDFKSEVRACSARTPDLEVRLLGGSQLDENVRPYGQFSAPVKPDREEEEKQNYYLNVGYAIRTLREELPELFHKELTLDIYRDDVVFKDPMNTFVGIENYKSIFWGIRFHGRMFFRALWVDIVSVWQPVEDVVMVRWTVHGVPRVLKKLQDDLESLGLRIKQHEENIRSFKAQKTKLDNAILDKQGILGNYHSQAKSKTLDEGLSQTPGEERTVDQILRCEKPAAGLMCQLETGEVGDPSHHALAKHVLGIVATLGKVAEASLSSLLSEYLGTDNMLAVVCKTYEGVKALETYENEGCIDKRFGLHGFGASVGRPINGRFLVICLEKLRPYTGNFVYDDPQRKLDLLKPRQPDGSCPPGFIGFAVNMIDIEATHLQFLTEYGHGIRETLFYHLFRRTQVYKTRTEMVNALPFISDGAISLDGGMIKAPGVYPLGNRDDVPVRFPVASESKFVAHYYETEKEMKDLKWKREKLLEDIQRERQLLDHAKLHFERKKQEFVKFLAHSSTYAQQQVQMGRDPSTPR